MKPRDVGLALIGLYRALAPSLRAFLSLPSECRMVPTCSEYAESAIRQAGLLKGSWAGFKRILRCNPLQKTAADPFVCVRSERQ